MKGVTEQMANDTNDNGSGETKRMAIKVDREIYEKNNKLRKQMGLTWNEYFDGRREEFLEDIEGLGVDEDELREIVRDELGIDEDGLREIISDEVQQAIRTELQAR